MEYSLGYSISSAIVPRACYLVVIQRFYSILYTHLKSMARVDLSVLSTVTFALPN